MTTADGPRLVVVGIGADGWAGMGDSARAALLAAEEIVGSYRQLELLPVKVRAQRRPWPSPIEPLVEELVSKGRGDGSHTCVLASGDPMLYGIGATLARRLGPERLIVHPHPSAFALACARLGWPEVEVQLLSAVGRPVETLARIAQPGRRIVVYVNGPGGAGEVAAVLSERGLGASRLVVLEQLGGPEEQIHESTAAKWRNRQAGALHAVAVQCRLDSDARPLALVPGLPDEVYDSDGQLTKWPIRSIAVAALAPLPGQLLWDVGAGSGSIAIEWLRAEPSARAIAVEADSERSQRIVANARTLGVPQLEVRNARAPEALDGLPSPDAVFIGGGVSTAGVIDRCWQALTDGGGLVANAVTIEGEHSLVEQRAQRGGELLRVELSDAQPIGGFSGWQPRRPVVQWSIRKRPS
jgi:precorrin-6B C5,15-methyltransferase / cobalt-precorrin-6B C5,C15-methyltransferase